MLGANVPQADSARKWNMTRTPDNRPDARGSVSRG
jgi:hypothetical protein